MKRLLAVAGAVALVPVMGAGPASAGGGCHGTYVPDAHGVSVAIRDFCFSPLVLRVPQGATVRWTNLDDTDHNVTGAAFLWGSQGDLRSGDVITFRFDRNGVFPYACTIHPGMVSAVVVGTGVRAASDPITTAAVTQVGDIVNRKNATTAVEPAPAEPVDSPSAAAVVGAAPKPPDAQPQAVASAPAVAVTPDVVPAAASSSVANDHGGQIVAGLALSGALVLAGVAFFARRTPPHREFVG
ncbi:MAG: plastocyanin/azurin family copper-binding protein [Actinomycetota bacterium]